MPEQAEEIPAWVTPRPKSSRPWIYLTGLVMVAAIAGGGLWMRGQFITNQANDSAITQTTSTPLLSDYERADRFLNLTATPAFAALITPLQAVEKDCTPKAMTAACKPDLIATDKALIAGETAFQQADVPSCVARQVNQLEYDWQAMEQGVGLAISGYNDNSYDLYLQGMVKFAELSQYIKPDMDRITGAEAGCSKAAR
jgi:hypothetical protein